MKKIIPFLAFVLLTVVASAQIIEIMPNPVLIHDNSVDLGDNYFVEEGRFDVNNLQSDSVSLYWVVVSSPECNPEWEFSVSDSNNGYTSNISSNYMPDSGLDNPCLIPTGITDCCFIFFAKPKGQSGCCTARMDFYLTNALDTIIESVEFDIKFNDEDCLNVATSEETASALTIFPNPVKANFQLKGNEDNDVKNLTVHNIHGQQVLAYDAASTNDFDISNLPSGIYFINMLDGKMKILKSVKIIKQ